VSLAVLPSPPAIFAGCIFSPEKSYSKADSRFRRVLWRNGSRISQISAAIQSGTPAGVAER
jgi:hypothetical protein